jgi:hypothetical protein
LLLLSSEAALLHEASGRKHPDWLAIAQFSKSEVKQEQNKTTTKNPSLHVDR